MTMVSERYGGLGASGEGGVSLYGLRVEGLLGKWGLGGGWGKFRLL